MDMRGWIGVLAAILLVSFAAGVHDPPATARLRILLAEESKSGQEEANRSPSRPGVLGPLAVGDSPPLGSNPPPASRAPFSPAPVLSPPSSNTFVPVPPSGTPLKSTNSSQNPLNRPPPPASPPPPPLATPRPSGSHSNGVLPSPGPSELETRAPPVGKNDKCPPPGTGLTSLDCQAKGFAACLQQLQNDSWILIVHNEGKIDLNLKVSAPPTIKIGKGILAPKNSSSNVTVDLGKTKDWNITLHAGKEICVLKPLPSPSATNGFSQSPYFNRVTPVHGIYVASFSIIFLGGLWACCRFRNRGRAGGARVAYQQLEMSSEHPPAALANENRVDGWDEHWSEDWDEEEALPRPAQGGGGGGGGPAKSSSDRNEWEDWDD